METICSCCFRFSGAGLANKKDGVTTTTPLLRNNHASTVTTVPTSVRHGSLRRHNQGEEDEEEQTHKVGMSVLDVPSLDKMFTDHANRYNSIHSKYQLLKQSVTRLKQRCDSGASPTPTIEDCVRVLLDRCGDAKLTVRRVSQYCVQLEYDRRDISNAAPDSPEDLLQVLELFNQANKLINTIIIQSPEVSSSVQRSIDMEKEIVKDVMKSGLDPPDEMIAMKHCNENMTKLKRIPGYLDIIKPETDGLFRQMLKATNVVAK